MAVLKTATTVQNQILDVVKAGQHTALSAVESLLDSAAPITHRLPAAPFAGRLPKPVDVIDNYFSFAQKLLAAQKDFALKLADSYSPAPTATKPAPKPATKATTKAGTKTA